MAKVSSFKNMLLCLLIITFAASALLGGVYVATYEPIAAAQKSKVNVAIATVVPEFDNDPSSEVRQVEVNGKQVKIYPALKGGVAVAYAVEATTAKGFGGPIVLMVGFLPDGSIYNTAVVSHTETPGLGDKMVQSKSNFSLQFKGKNPQDFKLSVRKDGGDVDAITASTISSRAFCDAVDMAYKGLQSFLGTQNKAITEKGESHE